VRERKVSRETLEVLRRDFRERFGRDPGPDDPVFFDPTAEEPRPLGEDGEALFIAMSEMAMRRAGIDPGSAVAATALARALAGTTSDPAASTTTPLRTRRRAVRSRSVASSPSSEASRRTPEIGSPDRVATAGSTAFKSAVNGFVETVSFM
jgi:hypothetical protein